MFYNYKDDFIFRIQILRINFKYKRFETFKISVYRMWIKFRNIFFFIVRLKIKREENW